MLYANVRNNFHNKMVKFTKKLCRLCLKDVDNTNSEAIGKTIQNILTFILLKLTNLEENTCVVCHICSEKLFAALNFKSGCILTDATIIKYIQPKDVLPIDLKEIYIREANDNQLEDINLANQTICRLCMTIVNGEFIFFKALDKHMINKFIPEINFMATKDPVICRSCSDAIHNHSSFIEQCLVLEDSFKSDRGNIIIPEESEGGSCQSTRRKYKPDTNTLTCCICVCQTEEANAAKYSSRLKKNPKRNSFICGVCSYKTLHLEAFRCHLTSHKISFKKQIIKCNECGAKTKDINVMKRHMAKHMNIKTVYSCNKCLFKTFHIRALRAHKLSHIDVSGRTYECDVCKKKFTLRRCLYEHVKVHMPREVYKCDFCEHTTISKCNARLHSVKHKDSEVFKCDSCNYETKVKLYLKAHVKIHMDRSLRCKFACDECGFRAISKHSLCTHKLKHKDPAELETYTCQYCAYETKYKGNLTSHVQYHHLKYRPKNKRSTDKQTQEEADLSK